MMTLPSVDEIDRIAEHSDPVIRNLQITQCYYEISQCVAGLMGHSANWCSFATWASKQAGKTIRQEDLIRAFEERFYLSNEIAAAVESIFAHLEGIGAKLQAQLPKKAISQALNPTMVFVRAGDAVARGNKKVFEEIGQKLRVFSASFTTTPISIATKLRVSAAHSVQGSRRRGNGFCAKLSRCIAKLAFNPARDAPR